MDFQQSQFEKLLNLWVDLGQDKNFETTVGFPTNPLQKLLKLWLDL